MQPAIRRPRSKPISTASSNSRATIPKASRLFAMEIIQGAPVLGEMLAGRLKKLVDEKAAVIRRWVAEGRLAPVDPYHFIFMIWATTQHYADFEVQIRAILGNARSTARRISTLPRRRWSACSCKGIAKQ